MMLSFTPISLENQDKYLTYFSRSPQKTSDYSFVNLWGWAEVYGLSWAWENDLVWLKQTRPEVCFWAPVGAWQVIEWAERFNRHSLAPCTFTRVPQDLAEMWNAQLGRRLRIEPAKDQWDYLYRVNDLVDLKGNRYHKKKNLLNQFQKHYDYVYRPLGADGVTQALALQAHWCTWRDCESSENLSAENRVIERILKNWSRISRLTGGALMVEGKMAAYTIAEPLTDEMLLIHFEKADPEFKGSYQAINQMFLAHAGGNFAIVNREQDLGDEGLRKAKLSYHPVDFLRKSAVEVL